MLAGLITVLFIGVIAPSEENPLFVIDLDPLGDMVISTWVPMIGWDLIWIVITRLALEYASTLMVERTEVISCQPNSPAWYLK